MVTAVCYGGGWDSTAMLIEMVRRGERPDLITMADVGGEKRYPDPEQNEQIGTMEFVALFDDWLRSRDFPGITLCTYQPKPATQQRYQAAAEAVCNRLGLKVSDNVIAGLAKLYGNMVANDTLPGIAFGPKSCSLKWKLEAQEPT